jgi:hypothetical protein
VGHGHEALHRVAAAPPRTATANDVQQSLKAINSDLSKIKDAQGDLSDDRRQQVEAANKTFATAYQQSFARVDCS